MPLTAAIAHADAVATPTTRSQYLQNWDRLRVVAALDIVGLHLTGEHALFGFGLPLFLMLSVALGVSKPTAPPTERFISRRASKVLAPWLFWAIALTGLRAYFRFSSGEPAFGWVEWPMVFYGPRVHLWFLPFIVAAGLCAHLAHKHLPRVHPWAAALVALVIAVALLPIPPTYALAWPFDQWLFSLPAIFFGFALGRAVSSEPDLTRLRLLLTAGYALFGLLVGVLLLFVPSVSAFALRYAGGLGLLVAASWLPNRLDRFTRQLTPLMLGVYVLHPAVWAILLKPIVDAQGYGGAQWLRVALTFPLTMLLVAGLRRTPLARFC